ncbi:MAG: PEP-CTERM sorting domain-containing protein [Planctomycetaceae bacterium]
MIRVRSVCWMVTLSLLSGLSAKADLITPIESQTNVILDGELHNDTTATSDSDHQEDVDTQGGTLDPLSSSTSLSVSIPDMSIDAQGFVSATWSSATSGHVDFNDVGWAVSNTTPGGSFTGGTWNVSTLWDYRFTGPDAPFTLTVNYDIFPILSSGAGGAFDGHGFTIERYVFIDPWIYAQDGLYNVSGSSGTWQTTFPTLAGIYGVRIYGYSGATGGVFTAADFLANGTFDWSISEATAVPEPSSLALLGTGVLGLIAIRRRQKTRRG